MNYQPLLQQLYPEGSVQGECGVFCHRLVNFPLVGNTLQSKIAAVHRFGIPVAQLQGQFHPGDIIITSESKVYGHVTFVNELVYQENTDNLLYLQLTESNFNLDLKVHHTRLLAPNSPFIIGVIRGPLLFAIPENYGQ